MYPTSILHCLVAVAGVSTALPAIPRSYNIPAGDGFPNPSPEQLTTIQQKAGGQLSNAPPPPKLAPTSLTAFQLIAFNENFEVAFFSSLIDNITNNVAGFEVGDSNKKDGLLSVLEAVKAQEELHAINAHNVLTKFGAFAPPPCTYKFPTSDINSAITLAETFTALVLGTLQDASQLLATNGDAGPVRGVASVIGQEGEQNGWYRTFLGLKPSEKPFLTTSVAAFAFSALTGQNLPVSQPVTNVSWDGKIIKFEAPFPFVANLMDGLSVAALTTKADFSTPADVVTATLAAPGLVQVNDKL